MLNTLEKTKLNKLSGTCINDYPVVLSGLCLWVVLFSDEVP